jgi:aspartyl/glutamyl-tRNA(Asn/Gln) amidotransferase subunit C (EC 6.3.5.-)
MAISEAEVRHVARLARLALSDEEIAVMQAQLSAILDYIAMLQEVDVSNVPPTAQVTG